MTHDFNVTRRFRAAAIACGFLLALANVASAQTVRPTTTGTIIGFISDSSGTPIPGADIMVSGGQSMRTDSLGNFVVRLVPSGRVLILVRKLGYTPHAVAMQLPPGGTGSAPIVMARGTQVLPTVRVGARSDTLQAPDYHGIHKFDLFYQRRAADQGGTFFTRSQIRQRGPAKLSDLLTGAMARLPRCANPMVGQRADYALFVDDLPYATGGASSRDILDAIPPWDVEGLEIYTSPSELPVEAMGNACAAIFIWMHSVEADTSK